MELEKSKELPYVDRIDIEEVFADQIRFVQFDGYSVRIEFAVTRPHVTGQNQAESTLYPAARLVLVHTAVRVAPRGDPAAAELPALWAALVARLAP